MHCTRRSVSKKNLRDDLGARCCRSSIASAGSKQDHSASDRCHYHQPSEYVERKRPRVLARLPVNPTFPRLTRHYSPRTRCDEAGSLQRAPQCTSGVASPCQPNNVTTGTDKQAAIRVIVSSFIRRRPAQYALIVAVSTSRTRARSARLTFARSKIACRCQPTSASVCCLVCRVGLIALGIVRPLPVLKLA